MATYILAKSSNRPLTFRRFSSKLKSILLFYLHPQIGRYVNQLKHQKVWQNSEHYIQDALMNTSTPIFKIHKSHQFVTICQKSLSEISNFQNHFITKAYDWRNTFIQKWTLFQHDSGCYGSKCQNIPHHSMQILVNFENGGTHIHQCLLCVMYWIMLNLLVVWFTDILACLDMQT